MAENDVPCRSSSRLPSACAAQSTGSAHKSPILEHVGRWTMTREKLAKRLGTEDRKRREDVSDHEDVEKFIAVLLDWRDEHLIGIIEQHRREPANAAGCIGIVYGAQHMRAVLRHLIGRLGYRVAKAEWVTVFDL